MMAERQRCEAAAAAAADDLSPATGKERNEGTVNTTKEREEEPSLQEKLRSFQFFESLMQVCHYIAATSFAGVACT